MAKSKAEKNKKATTGKKENTSAKNSKKETAEATDKRKAVKKPRKSVKIKFLKSPIAVYKLAYNIGETVSINPLQAEELVEAGYAEIVK